MTVFVNSKNEIKAVNSTTDQSLTPIEIDDEANPFNGWTEAKICCFKIVVDGNRIVGLSPYINSKLLDHFSQLGNICDTNAEDIVETQIGLTETYEATETNATDIIDLELALCEVYELLEGIGG